ncbi:ceramide kinase-like [Dendropsophus ebraccatus]|uniref:ceramide kinase-like n=1 Tax=Dendropsophus ebraccatus TaxID=150705 RepID=UPI003831AC52
MEKENLLRIRGTEALVTLGPSTLSWSFHKKPARRHESISVSIPFNEIITVQKCHIKQEETPENVPDINFTVYHVSRTSSHRWSLKVVTFTAQDTQMAHSWVQAIQKKIIQTGDKRPKKLLVFINPYGGRG